MALRLAKSGYFGGDPDQVLQAPYATVLAVLAYEKFDYQYGAAYHELNRETR